MQVIHSNAARNVLGNIGNLIRPTAVNNDKNLIKPKIATNGVCSIVPTTTTIPVKVQPQQQQQPQIVQHEEVAMDVGMEEWPENVVDIDEADAENSQLASEYVKDIYVYLNEMERRFRVSSAFLDNKIVTVKMRSVLIDWLVQVHLKFHLLQETLYLCVQIIDAYLEMEDVPKQQLQLVGVAAMFVASKYEEMYVPAIDDFVYMTDNTYTKAEIRQMEISILKRLGFMLGKPLPLHFLRRFSKAAQADPKQHTLAKYLMELSLHDAEFASVDPSLLAACSLCFSMRLIARTSSYLAVWTPTLEHYSNYKRADLMSTIQKLAKLVIKSQEDDYKYKAVNNKYATSKFMRISMLPELRSYLVAEASKGITN